ncbi:putative ArsR family transcriptional regulator [Kribbella orskensis]|uniref:ArsR family transcriptional regulator n=1 Tax=Kribbella orskensis TaxID=2512216 RepID=A0ABY2BD11_9ACTN|nr:MULTISPECIES: helix-turn-helix domain-containing protein [Kribbella]TCN32892.1 putative ArsR family transcriptional regulator [Kribbella sp. VKM Ac-2500]TCO13234.1 putative ArsR family transcriptional regulator [Kribbella orskensis]
MTRVDRDDADKPRREAVLEALRASDDPLGVTELAERLGIHPNTVRFHLDALVTQGLVDRKLEEPSGRGRPRTVHAPHPGMDRGGRRQYHLLAKILLGQLSTSPDAGAAAEAAGRSWGGYLVEQVAPSHQIGAAEATQRLTAMMTDLGFAPEPAEDDRIRLRHCPFLELAEEYSSTLCPLHLGLMRGALTEIRAPIAATRLEPFAEPDACLVHLSPTHRQAAAKSPKQRRPRST